MNLSMPEEQELIYHIDGSDRICAVGADWAEFALANDGTAALPEKVLGRSLWDFIEDANVRELYRQIVLRVRSGYPAQFEYRCDAPEWRRRFRMTIRAGKDGTVEFLSQLIRAEPRPRVDMLDVKATRSEQWVSVCGWCQKVALPDQSWVSVEEAARHLGLLAEEALPKLTHGICPPCHLDMLTQLVPTDELPGHSPESDMSSVSDPMPDQGCLTSNHDEP